MVDHRAIGVSANFGWNTFSLELKIVDLDSKRNTRWTMIYAEKQDLEKVNQPAAVNFGRGFLSNVLSWPLTPLPQ